MVQLPNYLVLLINNNVVITNQYSKLVFYQHFHLFVLEYILSKDYTNNYNNNYTFGIKFLLFINCKSICGILCIGFVVAVVDSVVVVFVFKCFDDDDDGVELFDFGDFISSYKLI